MQAAAVGLVQQAAGLVVRVVAAQVVMAQV
jgi:hypothetical protein